MFELPAALDLAATFFFALTGALAARRKGYDFVGVYALALGVGVGGGLLRDGVLMARTPAVMQDPAYLTVVAAAGTIGIFFGVPINRFRPVFDLADALGLGLYTVVGVQKGLSAGFGWAPAVLTGVVSAAGGGLLRDLLSREEPMLFKPGHLYAGASVLGSGFFLGALRLGMPGRPAAYATIAVVVLVRVLSLWLNWQSRPVESKPG
jgi:uncharacterized membrane protein YeiH